VNDFGVDLTQDGGTLQVGADGAITRRVRVDGRTVAIVTVRVADDAAGAHAALLAWLTTASRAAALDAASDHGLALGHVAFAETALDGPLAVVLFVRGNIAVMLRRVDEESAVDLATLAEALDVLIAETPVVKDAAALPKPSIAAFGLAAESVAAGDEAELDLDATSPDNDELDVQFEIDPNSTGAGYVQRRDGKWVFVGERAGTVTLRVHVTTATGLRTTATTTITVD